MTGRITPRAPLDWELSCRASRPPGAGGWREREYRRVVWIEGRAGLLRLRGRGVVDRPELEWRVESGQDATAAAAVAHRVAAAAVDLDACYRQWAREPALAALAQRLHGLRLVQAPSLYEALLEAIVARQLPFAAAARKKELLQRQWGVAVDLEGETYYGYPPPETLARLRVERLQELGLPAGKSAALVTVARAAAAGRLDETTLAALPAEAAVERLAEIGGVGGWTAAVALLRGLGHTDALPFSDAGIRRRAGKAHGLRQTPSPQALGRRWRGLSPWRGYAAFYMSVAETEEGGAR